jgi:hypothetical protein
MALLPRSMQNLSSQIENKLSSQADALRSSATDAFNSITGELSNFESSLSGVASELERLGTSELGNAISLLEDGGLVTDAIANFDAASFQNILDTDVEDLFNDFLEREFSLETTPLTIEITRGRQQQTSGNSGGSYSTPSALPNELEKFASANYRFTFGMLSPNEVNDPLNSYRVKTPETVIVNSGGGEIRGATPLGGEGLEFFIDNVELASIIAPTSRTRTSNATTINFQVTEPYSMGLFLQSCIVAAQKNNLPNFNRAPYYLIIEWVGWDDEGTASTSQSLRKVYPIQLINMEFNVNEGGCTYEVQAIPWNDQSLSNQIQETKTDLEIQGSNLAEILQTGARSLTTSMNTRIAENTQTETTRRQDEYIIIFPRDIATQGSANGGNEAATQRATDTSQSREAELYESLTGNPANPIPENFDAFRSRLLGLEARSSTAENIRQTVQTTNSLNNIGQATIADSVFTAGETPFGIAAFEWDETNQVFTNGGSMQVSQDLRTFKFPRGTKIERVIEELVLISSYGKAAATALENSRGNIPWFRVDTQTYLVPNNQAVSATGDNPKIHVFRVIPYEVQSSHFQQPTTPTVGAEEIARNVSKVYNYIYTGQNKDILDFNIDFKLAYFQSQRADGAMSSSDTRTQAQDAPAPQQGTTLVQNEGQGATSQSGTTVVQESAQPQSDRSGGSRGTETPEVAVARQFQEALVDGVDMINIEMKIMGDPYYMADSGMGNYSSGSGRTPTINADGAIDYQRNEVHFIVNFRTPIDIGDNGLMEFPNSSVPVNAFSGLYRLTQVDNDFSDGNFTQTLHAFRVPNQPLDTGISGTPGENSPFVQGDAANNINNDPTLASGIVTNVQEAVAQAQTIESRIRNAFNVGFTDIQPNINLQIGGETINISQELQSQLSNLNLTGDLSQITSLQGLDLESSISELTSSIDVEGLKSTLASATANIDTSALTSSLNTLSSNVASTLESAGAGIDLSLPSVEDVRSQVTNVTNTVSRNLGGPF